MPQSLVQIYLHLVFSTKQRETLLRDPRVREQTHAYLGGICRNLEFPALIVGGTADHVHLLCRQSKNQAVCDLLRDLKRASSLWIKGQAGDLAGFQWQHGYGAFSVSPSHVEALVGYIRGQEEHHAQVSYQDEIRTLCRKYGLEIDERYAWE
jgi:REP element-mobilizing transposase RayT